MSREQTITIRPARGPDRAEVEALLEAEDLASAFVAEEFLVAVDGDDLVGCVRLAPLDDGWTELASLAVEPDQRGQGIGQRLTRQALERADGLVHALCLQPGFFEQVGFERIDEIPAPLAAKAQACCADRDIVPMVWRRSE